MDSLTTYWNQIEEENSKKGMAGSVIFHMLLLIIFFLPAFTSVFPPPGPQGVLVSFGNPTNEAFEKSAPAKSATDLVYKNEENATPPVTADVAEAKPPSAAKPAVVPAPVKEVKAKYERTVDNTQAESAVVLKEKKEKERKEELQKQKEEKQKADAQKAQEQKLLAEQQEKERKKQEDEAAAQKQQEAEQKRKAEEAKKQAEEEKRRAEEARKKQEAYDQTKSELGGLFSGEDSDADGAGQQGDPSGKDKSDILEGLSSGQGKIGGGLSGRGIVFEPTIKENSQKTGIVVVKVCVDKSGKVLSSKYTQRGSTTTESELVKVATESAAKYVFSPGELDEQCGTITIDFRLK